MDYAFLITAAALYSFMFLFNGKYQKNNGTGLKPALAFSLYTSVVCVIIYFALSVVWMISKWSVVSVFELEFTWFSFFLAIGSAAVNIGFSFFSIKALDVANLSLFSIFAMLGGMLLPSLYGLIFSGEPMTWGKAACYALIIVALCLTFEKGDKQGKKSLFYCFGVFVLNGLSGVVTSIHQEDAFVSQAVNSGSYMMMTRGLCVVISLALFLVFFKKMPALKLKDSLSVSGYGFCGGMGNLLQFIALATLDSSVLFPIVTGGTMLFSMIVSIVIGEKPKAKTIITSVIAAASTVLMMF